MLNLAVILEDSARRQPDKTAFRFGGHEISYRDLDRQANQVAAGLLGLGIERGDKVALSCPNLPQFPIVYFGILKAGAVVVPLNVLLKAEEIGYHLRDSEARAFVCFEGTAELPMLAEGRAGFELAADCRELIAIPAGGEEAFEERTLSELMAIQTAASGSVSTTSEDTAVILYTSGTTGRPKGAELSHANLLLNAGATAQMERLTADDTALLVLPLFHSFGQSVIMNGTILAGGTCVLLPRFDPQQALELIKTGAITIFGGVPTMYWALLQAAAALPAEEQLAGRLRLCISGGASLPLQVLRDFEDRFEVPILEGYGLSETSPVASFNQLDRPRKAGSIGTPIWGIEMRVADQEGAEVPVGETGEVLIRGHNLMKGYYRRPDETAEAFRSGWFHSGDIGRMDEDGFFYIVDRTKDMIIRGGFNVYPREIEEMLLEHPEISMAAVVGFPHDSHGEEIKAFLVLNPGSSLDQEAVISWSRERMAAYKYPRVIEFRDSLPMTATGKILKTELRDEAG